MHRMHAASWISLFTAKYASTPRHPCRAVTDVPTVPSGRDRLQAPWRVLDLPASRWARGHVVRILLVMWAFICGRCPPHLTVSIFFLKTLFIHP